MPKYFFHIRDGEYMPDEVGMELSGLAAAKRETIAFASRLMANNADKFWGGEDWFVEVTDDRDLLLFKLKFSAIMAPALQAFDEWPGT